MIGGELEVVEYLDPIFVALAPGEYTVPKTSAQTEPHRTPEKGYLYCGPHGAGHFVKMVHNGIEYGMMAAYAEGMNILKNASIADHSFNLPDIAEVWRRGSVISSWLLDLTANALHDDPDLKHYSGYVSDSGEGRWTIMAALDEAVPVPVLSAALYARFTQ